MSTPNEYDLVVEVANQNPELLERNTKETILEFMMILGPRLHETDRNWGYLTKTAGEKHLVLPDGQFIAVDAFIYAANQQVVDVLSNAADPQYGPARPAWSETDKRDENHWYPIKEYEDDGGDVIDPGKDSEQDEKIADLEARVEALEQTITEMKMHIDTIDENSLQIGSSVSLRMSRGKILSADNGGGDESMQSVTFSSRDEAYADESFKLERGQ